RSRRPSAPRGGARASVTTPTCCEPTVAQAPCDSRTHFSGPEGRQARGEPEAAAQGRPRPKGLPRRARRASGGRGGQGGPGGPRGAQGAASGGRGGAQGGQRGPRGRPRGCPEASGGPGGPPSKLLVRMEGSDLCGSSVVFVGGHFDCGPDPRHQK